MYKCSILPTSQVPEAEAGEGQRVPGRAALRPQPEHGDEQGGAQVHRRAGAQFNSLAENLAKFADMSELLFIEFLPVAKPRRSMDHKSTLPSPRWI